MPKPGILILRSSRVCWRGLQLEIGKVPDVRLVGEARMAEDALRQAQNHCPDLILLGLDEEGISAAALISSLHAECPLARIAVISEQMDSNTQAVLFKAGAAACLLWSLLTEESLPGYIATLLGGATITAAPVGGTSHAPPSDPAASIRRLSHREREVLQLLLEGLSVKETAARLDRAPSTISTHVGRIRQKLGGGNRNQILSMVIKLGLDAGQSDQLV